MIRDKIIFESNDFEKQLREFFESKKELYAENLYEAMEYMLFGGGKRIRPVLVRLSADFLDINRNKLNELAIALELIHTYSLIHDDLPCMDNDDYRRGKPTCHKKYGEAMAVLAGDAFLNLAYETMFEAVAKDNKLFISANLLAKCAGSEGMIGGQVADMTLNKPSEKEILDMYKKKTACLIKAAVLMPAYLHINEREYKDLSLFGEKLGLLFQLSDDMIDIEDNERNSYIYNFGLERTKTLVECLKNDIHELLSFYGDKATVFLQLTDYLSTRKK